MHLGAYEKAIPILSPKAGVLNVLFARTRVYCEYRRDDIGFDHDNNIDIVHTMNVSILHCKANMMLEATAVSLFPLLSHDRSSLAETMPMIGMEGAVTYTRLFLCTTLLDTWHWLYNFSPVMEETDVISRHNHAVTFK